MREDARILLVHLQPATNSEDHMGQIIVHDVGVFLSHKRRGELYAS